MGSCPFLSPRDLLFYFLCEITCLYALVPLLLGCLSLDFRLFWLLGDLSSYMIQEMKLCMSQLSAVFKSGGALSLFQHSPVCTRIGKGSTGKLWPPSYSVSTVIYRQFSLKKTDTQSGKRWKTHHKIANVSWGWPDWLHSVMLRTKYTCCGICGSAVL